VNAFGARFFEGSLRTLLGAWLLACAAGWAFSVAIAVYAFDHSGATAVGLVLAARLLPAVLAAPLTGWLIDRIGRGSVVAGACALQGACLGASAAVMTAHGSLWPIVVLAAITGAAATAPRPALEALMPALAKTPEELTHATATWGAIDNTGFLLGGGAGAASMALLGAGAVTAVAAGLFVAAAFLALRLPWVTATETDEPEVETAGLADALAGLRTLGEAPSLRVAFLLLAGLLVVEGATEVQLPALSIGHLHMGNGGPGELYIVWGIGGVLGSAVLLALVRRRGYGLALLVGCVSFAVGVGVAGADGIPLALLAMLPAGVGMALVEVAFMALVPRLADDAVAGRVYGLAEVAYSGAAGIGALLAPPLIHWLGTPGSLAAGGVAFGLLAVGASATLARLDTGQEKASRVRELLRGVSFLAPLPLPRLERLVRGAHPLVVPAGGTVFRAGELGSEFYVIDEGSVEVEEYGRQQGPGSGFGEIALLLDIPRTATVRAVTDVRLWRITRRAFLAAVSAHGDVGRLAHATVDEHLARPLVAEGQTPTAPTLD
jgi:MFS family permease